MQNRSIDTSFDSESYAKCIKFTSHYTYTHTQVNLVLAHTHAGPNLIPAIPPPKPVAEVKTPSTRLTQVNLEKGGLVYSINKFAY